MCRQGRLLLFLRLLLFFQHNTTRPKRTNTRVQNTKGQWHVHFHSFLFKSTHQTLWELSLLFVLHVWCVSFSSSMFHIFFHLLQMLVTIFIEYLRFCCFHKPIYSKYLFSFLWYKIPKTTTYLLKYTGCFRKKSNYLLKDYRNHLSYNASISHLMNSTVVPIFF